MNDLLAAILQNERTCIRRSGPVTLVRRALLALSLFGLAWSNNAQSVLVINDCGVSYIDPQDAIAKNSPSYDTLLYRTEFAETARQRAYYVDVNAFGGRQVDRAIVSAIMPDGGLLKLGEIAFGNCVGCVDGFALVYNDSVWVENVRDQATMDLWLQSFAQPPFSLTGNLQTFSGVGRVSGLLPLCAQGMEVRFIVYSDPASTTTEFAAQVVCPRELRSCEIAISADADCGKDSIYLRADLPAACFSAGARLSWWNKAGFYAETAQAALPLTDNEGWYYFRVMDEYCSFVDSILVENPSFAEAGPDQTVCQGSDAVLTGGGGARHFWEAENNDRREGAQWPLPAVQQVNAGRYVLHAFNEQGCEDTDTLQLEVRVPPTPEVAVSETCLGDSLFFQVRNDSAFVRWNWFDPQRNALPRPLIFPLRETDLGTYSVEAFDAFGCRSEAPFIVRGGLPPAFQYVIEDDCDSARVYLSPPDYRYQWDHGPAGPFLSTNTGGIFGLTITDSLGCQTKEIIDVPPPDGPEIDVAIEHPKCPNEYGSVELILADPDLPAIFSIDGGQTYTLSTRFEALSPGAYTLIVQDDLGCLQRIPVEILAADTLGVDIGLENLEVRPGTTVRLSAETLGPVVRYQWLPKEIDTGTAQTEFVANTNLDIRLIVEDERGCRMSDGFPLTIVLGDIYAPNAFSPNKDGANDRFLLYSDNTSGEIIEYLRLFDRYGELLFEARDILPNDESGGWDGAYRGKPMNTGVYVYHALVRFGNGARKEYKGDVVLLR